MEKKILVFDRVEKKIIEEKVYGKAVLEAFYGKKGFLSKWVLPFVVLFSFVSKVYGWMQKTSYSRRKIAPFLKEFDVDATEFLNKVDSFNSFNDFFIRKLKPEARPITPGKDVAILPADGRYLVFPNIEKADGFIVKGKKFSLCDFLQDEELAKKYQKGSMVIARLCPTDYHRYHFPCSAIPSKPKQVQGSLHSVNPLALRQKVEIFSENKREITLLQAGSFGLVAFVEVGATCVGSIHHTFCPDEPYAKGDEMGYFSFGGSSLVLFFEPEKIQFDQDLLESSEEKIEVKGLMGQSLGRAFVVC